MLRINGKTRIVGFVGEAYEASRVYSLYNDLFEHMQLNYVYVPFSVTDVLRGVDSMKALGIHAIGVSMPFKSTILPYLDDLDESSKRIGAVNVVRNDGGYLVGRNTDGIGALQALEEEVELDGRNVVIIGSGGASRAIADSLVSRSIDVTLIGINEDETRQSALNIGCKYAAWASLIRTVQAGDIVINATPVGMAGTRWASDSPIPEGVIRAEQVIMDIVIVPANTPLLIDASSTGCKVIRGERMLLWQAMEKFKIYTGQTPSLTTMESALRI